MTKVRFIKSLWRAGTMLTPSSEDPKHPALDTQIDTKEMYWKSGAIEKLVDGGLNLWESATDLTHWTEVITGGSTVNREATDKIEGSYSCRIDIDASNNGAGIRQDFSMIPLKKHKLIFWYKNSVSGKSAYFYLGDSEGNVYLKEDGTWNTGWYGMVLANSTVWKKHELEFYGHVDYLNYRMMLYRNSAASSSIYFDKCALKECPSIDLDVGEFEPAGAGTMSFYAGKVEPTVGEWLYGAGAQGKVASVVLSTGTWQGEDAAGTVVLEKCEGRFNDDENITGSVSGENFMKMGTPYLITADSKVANGGFSADTTGWTPFDCTLASIAGGQIGNCLEITRTGANYQGATQTGMAWIVGKLYKVSVYVKSGTSGDENFRVKVWNGSGYDTIINSTTTSAWVKHTVIFKAKTTVGKLQLQKNTATAGTMLFDEVSLYEINHPDEVVNGEFEKGTDGWTAGTGATLAIVAGGKTGNCLSVTCDGTGNRYGYQKIEGLTVGKIYKVVVHHKNGTGTSGQILFSSAAVLGGDYWYEASLNDTDWTSCPLTFVAKTVNCWITLRSQQANNSQLFDEVSLYELDEEDTEKEIDFFALLDHNLSPTAQIKLIGAMDTAFSKALKTITIPYHKENIRAFLPGEEEILEDGPVELWASPTDLDWWTESLSGTSTVNREDSEVHGGTYSCRIDIDANNNSAFIYQIFPMIPGKKYRLVIWYKNSIAEKIVTVQLRDSGSNVFLKDDGTWLDSGSLISLPNSTVWKKFEVEFYAHEDYSSYYLFMGRIGGDATSSSIYLDDASVARLPLNDRIAIPVLRRYWKPEITDPDNPDGYIKGAYISIGKYFEPSRSFVKPHEKGDDDLSEGEYSDGGVFFGQEKEILETWLLPFKGLTTVSKDAIDAFIKYHKKIHAFIVVFDSDNPNNDSHLVKLKSIASRPYQHKDYWNWKAPLVEVK
ncbi:MAG: hypothetical protein KAV87_62760 [Desulfobacteraceae bacterium]|nr:hypothetical protein [Desulfobacteraceae bacterium]